MRAKAIILTVLALAAALAGFVLIWTPWLGCLLSYAAPLLATIGLVHAVRARRGAKREGGETWPATLLAATNLIVLPFVALFALSCGTLNGIGSVAIAGVGLAVAAAPTAAAMAIDEQMGAEEFWGSDRSGGGYFGSYPNPVGIGPTESEGEVRAAIRRTVVGTAFLLAAYVYVFGEPASASDPDEASPPSDPDEASPPPDAGTSVDAGG